MTRLTLQRHEVNDGTLRLTAAGEIDLATSDVLAEAISAAIASGTYAELVVDLNQVTFLDSTGISILIAGHHAAAASGLTYSVINPHGMVRRTLDVTGVLATLTQTI